MTDRTSPDSPGGANGEIDTAVRLATPTDAPVVARLLHEFNTEFDTPSPGVDVLADRLTTLLVDHGLFAILAGIPATGVALVSVRPNVWYAGDVALLEELYVVPDQRNNRIGTAIIEFLQRHAAAINVEAIEINVDGDDVDAQRFYERHGYTSAEPDTGERAFYYFRELPT